MGRSYPHPSLAFHAGIYTIVATSAFGLAPARGQTRDKEKPSKHVFDGFSDAFECLDIQVLYFSHKAFSVYHSHL